MPSDKIVLIIDDNEVNRMILKKIFNSEYVVLEAENGQAALDLLADNYLLVEGMILDIAMPVMDGYEFLTKMKDYPEYANIPVIVSTGNTDKENEIKALEMGAWDFVSKPYSPEIIKFRMKNAIERSQLSAFHQLKYLSEYDALTGIFNRNKFITTTDEMLTSFMNESFVFVRYDIDRFSLVNSFYGSEEGDRLLKYLAKVTGRYVGSYDKHTYGRIEADVFAFCISYKGNDDVYRLIEHLRAEFKAFNHNFDINPSFGVYIVEDHKMPVAVMLDKANLASRKCKGSYLKNYAVYNENMSKNVEKEQEIINEMNEALTQNQFCIYLQPKYNIQENYYEGAEALVRWNHPKKGMISPGDFIPVFERNGFISKLDYYVWENVCKLLSRWIKEGRNPNPISVNVSRVNMYNPNLVEDICALTKKYNVPNELFQLELTESAYTDNPHSLMQTMEKFHQNGFVVLMDDFGSGYSSLNILKDIPVDVLKIDMKFLSNDSHNGRGENIIASVIRMAKWLKIPTIAEGVEKEEQVEFLRGIGCESVQGYYFAKPMPVEEYEQLNKTELKGSYKVNIDEFNNDELWASDQQFQKIFSGLSHPVAMYEFDGEKCEIIRVNAAYYDAFGFDEMSYQVHDATEHIEDDTKALFINALQYAVKNKSAASCEYKRKLSTGFVWIENKIKYVNKIGNKYVLFGRLEDISYNKKIDLELQNYRNIINAENSGYNRILVVDDGEINRKILRSIFKNDFEVLEAENGESAITVLEQNDYKVDVILLDLVMPVMDGFDFLEYKQSHSEMASIPVVIITADDDPEQQLKTLSFGANDYVVKPFVPEIVLRRVANVIDSNLMYQKSFKKHHDMLLDGDIDEQTGLCKNDVAEKLIQNIITSDNSKNTFALFDVKGFSNINAKYGHKIGDEILKKISDILNKNFRDTDIITRRNGDEFMVFMLYAEDETAVSERINKVLSQLKKININEAVPECVAAYTIGTENCKSFNELYENAKAKLEKVKNLN